MSREEDLMHNKKDWLVGRILDLEKANHEYCVERDKLSKELKQTQRDLDSANGKLGEIEPILDGLARLLAPQIAEELKENSKFEKYISETAYESASKWGDDNWVECGHDPLDE